MRPLLILDIDGTLVSSYLADTTSPPNSTLKSYRNQHDLTFTIPPDRYHFDTVTVYTRKRPHLEEFLAFCYEYFQVAYWTAGSTSYANALLLRLLTLDRMPLFVLTRDDCIPSHGVYYKDFQRIWELGYAPHEVLMLEDNPQRCLNASGNVVEIASWDSYSGENPRDVELLRVAAILYMRCESADVRL